jgi:hypothetical protein
MCVDECSRLFKATELLPRGPHGDQLPMPWNAQSRKLKEGTCPVCLADPTRDGVKSFRLDSIGLYDTTSWCSMYGAQCFP